MIILVLVAFLWIACGQPAVAQDSPVGAWIFGEIEGDDFEWMVEVKPDLTVHHRRVRGSGEAEPVRLEALEGDLYRVVPLEEPHPAFLQLLSDREALLILPGQVRWGRRMGGALPDEMLGDWEIPGQGIRVTLRADSIRIVEGEDARDSALHPVLPVGTTQDAVGVPADETETGLLHFRLIAGQVLVVLFHDEDNPLLLSRPGQTPAWLEELLGASLPPPP